MATMPLREDLRISVVVCTHDRPALLGGALRSVVQQDLPRRSYEVIVVDNGPRAAAREVVDSTGQDIRYVREPVAGLSRARNTGWRAARGRWVALLDDDAVADSSWLRWMLTAFEEGDGRRACVGGRVTPIWGAPRPPWLSDFLALVLTVADWSEEARPITDLSREWLVGANIAFERAVLERHGGFPEGLGRIGKRLLSGEEVFLQRRLLGEGRTCWFEPRAHVGHHVAAERLQRSWFRKRFYSQGVSDAVIWRLEKELHRERGLQRLRRELGPFLRSATRLASLEGAARETVHGMELLCEAAWRYGFVTGLMRRV